MRILFIAVGAFLLAILLNQKPMSVIHPLRLKPGQDLRKEIEAFVKENKIEAGYIITCAGSLTQYQIRFANQPDSAKGSGHFEIISLTGTLSTNGSKIHISIGDSTGQTIGGQLLEGNIIHTTAEIIIGESSRYRFTREKDSTTKREELQIMKY